MAATQVAIIYSTRLLSIRRIYVPDNDAQLSDPKLTGPGESKFLMPMANYLAAGGLDGLRAALAGQVGAAGNDLCAVLDGRDIVQNVVRADPSLLNDTKGLRKGWYFVEGNPKMVQTGNYVDPIDDQKYPINSAIEPEWTYNT